MVVHSLSLIKKSFVVVVVVYPAKVEACTARAVAAICRSV